MSKTSPPGTNDSSTDLWCSQPKVENKEFVALAAAKMSMASSAAGNCMMVVMAAFLAKLLVSVSYPTHNSRMPLFVAQTVPSGGEPFDSSVAFLNHMAIGMNVWFVRGRADRK